MRALVTGGGGFVGKAVVKALLKRGDEVVAFQRGSYPELEEVGARCVRGDLCDKESVKAAVKDVDVVFHVAAKTGFAGSADEFEAINVGGTENVVEACLENGIEHLVYCSSPSVILDGKDHRLADESVPYASHFLAHYPRTKAEAERRVLAANGRAGKGGKALHTCALRPHLIFGPGDEHLMPRLIARAKAGRLRIIGDGENEVDWTYVDNVAHAHLLAADALLSSEKKPAGKPYFITNGEPVKAWPWFNEILEALGLPRLTRKVPLGVARFVGKTFDATWRAFGLRGEPPLTEFAAVQVATSHTFRLENARRDLGYEPVVSLKEGLARTIPWLKAQLEAGRFS